MLDALRSAVDPAVADSPRQLWWGRHWREAGAQVQLARLLGDPLFRGRGVPHGDGRAVVLVPGFLAGDSTLAVLSGWLRRIGYAPHGSGMRFNVDCMDRALDRLELQVEGLHAETGRRVALIGHSRGGHFVKALAHRRGDLVSHGVSLGAGLDVPLAVSAPIMAAVLATRSVHERRLAPRGCMTGDCGCRAFNDYFAPFPDAVPLTSIYTRGDGCLRWQGCAVPYAHNVEVGGGHVGLAFERAAYAAIAEALAEPERARDA